METQQRVLEFIRLSPLFTASTTSQKKKASSLLSPKDTTKANQKSSRGDIGKDDVEDSDDESEEEDNDEDDDTKIGSLLILGLTSAQRSAPLLSQLSNFRVVGGEFAFADNEIGGGGGGGVGSAMRQRHQQQQQQQQQRLAAMARGGGMGGENDLSSPILNLWRFLAFGGVENSPPEMSRPQQQQRRQQQRQQRRPLGMCLLSSSDPGAGKSFEARRRAAAAGARYAYLRVNRTLSSVEFAAMLRAQLGTSRKNAKTSARNQKKKRGPPRHVSRKKERMKRRHKPWYISTLLTPSARPLTAHSSSCWCWAVSSPMFPSPPTALPAKAGRHRRATLAALLSMPSMTMMIIITRMMHKVNTTILILILTTTRVELSLSMAPQRWSVVQSPLPSPAVAGKLIGQSKAT